MNQTRLREEPRLDEWPKLLLLKVFWRSLFLQASWNPEGMQNLGLAYAVYPALEHLYPEDRRRQEAVLRHLTLFNTHPYVAAALVGGVLHHERRAALGLEGPEKTVAFKAALMGPLAALGDGFFWLSLRPAAGALCASLVPLLRGWAVVLFLVLYNSVHLIFRVRLFWMGIRQGDRLIEAVARANLPIRGARLRVVAAMCAGGLAAYLALDFGAHRGGVWGGLMAGGCLFFGVVAYVLSAKRFSSHGLLYLAAALATAMGAFL